MNFKAVYETVRNDYFPGWDRKCEWKFQVLDYIEGKTGFCHSETKTIKIIKDCTSRHTAAPRIKQVKCLLIHEISHAVSSPYHRKLWAARMRKASQRATQLGDIELAELIKDDTDVYEKNPNFSLRTLCREIDKFITYYYDSISKGNKGFEDVIKIIGDEYGWPPQELLKRFPRARSIYGKRLEPMRRMDKS